MPTLLLKDLESLNGFKTVNLKSFESCNGVSIDTRTISQGNIFVAIKGKNFDGHNFVGDALSKGASAVVVNKTKAKKILSDYPEADIFSVPDTVKAFGELAKIWRFKLNCEVIALTGSVGKTTTKEIIAALLERKYRVQKTVGNNNNHIGVPLTIFSANDEVEKLVLECGTNHPGEIEYLAKIANPDISLITMIGDSHLEFLKNRLGVFNEKRKLFDAALDRKGKIIVNLDDKYLRKYANKNGAKTYSFENKNADYYGEILKYDKFYRPKIRISKGDKKFEAKLPLYGEAAAKNFLAAFAVCSEAGLSFKHIKSAIKNLRSFDKRMNVVELNGTIIIEDHYNANPQSMSEALKFLGNIKTKRKIAALGDMFELGESSQKEHKNLKKAVIDAKVDEIFLIGKNMKYLYEELIKKTSIKVRHFSSREKLKEALEKEDLKNSAILVKGSRGMKMEEFLEVVKQKLRV